MGYKQELAKLSQPEGSVGYKQSGERFYPVVLQLVRECKYCGLRSKTALWCPKCDKLTTGVEYAKR